MSSLAVSQLTDSDLTVKLKEYGIFAGPITPTTRPLLEKKLNQKINGTSKCDEEIKEESTLVCCDEKQNEKVNDTPKMYFAVQVPLDARSLDENYILTDKKEALQLVKKYAGSRFKIFPCKELAAQYVNQPGDVIPASPKTDAQTRNSGKPVGESSQFRGPKPQDLVAFRRMLEQGKLEIAKSTVWGNPRYLISSGDTPTILQENFRYNALHVCCTKNQAGSAEVILSLLKDESLFKLMYPDDSNTTRLERMKFLIDLYLNTPDKGANETPLHFACKFGHVEVVQVLVMHKALDKERVNKYGEKPRDIVCNRMRNGGATIKQEIYNLLSEQCYVPLIRAVDDTEPPQITQPVSPEHVSKQLQADKYDSPKETPHTIRAMAGPMSPVQAEKFRKIWTTPPSPTMKDRVKYTSIRRGDPTKGMERIGRDLAHMLRIPWSEYWEFLDEFVDLSTPEGIDILESYLQEKGDQLSHEMSLTAEMDSLQSLLCNLELESGSTQSSAEEDLTGTNDLKGSTSVNKSLFRGVQVNHVQQNDLVNNKPNPFMPKSFLNAAANDRTNTQTSSVICDEIITNKTSITEIHDKKSVGEDLVKTDKSDHCTKSSDSVDDLMSLALSGLSVKGKCESSETSENCDTTDNAFMVKKFVQAHKLEVSHSSHLQERTLVSDVWSGQGKASGLTSSEINTKLYDCSKDVSANQKSLHESNVCTEKSVSYDTQITGKYTGAEDCESDQDSVDSYHTATDTSDEEEGLFEDSFDSTDGKTSPCVSFVYGREPSKADVDVLRAVSEAQVSPVRHPHVFSWRNAVTCFSEQSRTKWTSNTPGRRLSQSTPRKQAFTPRSRSLGMSPLLGSPMDDNDSSVSFSVSESSYSDSSITEDETRKQIRTNLIPSFLSETNA